MHFSESMLVCRSRGGESRPVTRHGEKFYVGTSPMSRGGRNEVWDSGTPVVERNGRMKDHYGQIYNASGRSWQIEDVVTNKGFWNGREGQ